jgi:hypothetical protein
MFLADDDLLKAVQIWKHKTIMTDATVLDKLESLHALVDDMKISLECLRCAVARLSVKVDKRHKAAVSNLSSDSDDSSDTVESHHDSCKNTQYLCVTNEIPPKLQLEILFETYKHNKLDPQGWTLDEVHETSTHIVGTAMLKKTLYTLVISIDLDNGFAAIATPIDKFQPLRYQWMDRGYVPKFHVVSSKLTTIVSDIVSFFTPPGKAPEASLDEVPEVAVANVTDITAAPPPEAQDVRVITGDFASCFCDVLAYGD